MRLSANTGFLFTDMPFPDRVGAAKAAGFDALEFHDEAQGCDPATLDAVLSAAGLPVLGLNTRMGPTTGCAAIAGAEDQALADFRGALAIADRVHAEAIHVLSGLTDADDRHRVLAANLARFADMTDRTLLIEPISARAKPGYALRRLEEAAEVIAATGRDRVKILFDCYHMLAEGEVLADALAAYRPLIGHVQIASFPDRALPSREGPDYAALVQVFKRNGITALGCEFHAAGPVNTASLRALLT